MRIALIDDHQLLTNSLYELLIQYENIECIRVYNSPSAFLKACNEEIFDVIVIDIILPEMNGMELLSVLKGNNVTSKILFLTSITEVPTIRQALRKGADGYLGKDCTPDELYEAATTIMMGETYIGSSLRNSLIKRSLVEEKLVYHLSPREKEVLNLVCSGKTIKEAAYAMGLSIYTVQSYHKSILRKFNLNRSADLIVFAINNGLYYSELHK